MKTYKFASANQKVANTHDWTKMDTINLNYNYIYCKNCETWAFSNKSKKEDTYHNIVFIFAQASYSHFTCDEMIMKDVLE